MVVESGKSILSIDNGYIILASLSQSSANGPSDIWLSEYLTSKSPIMNQLPRVQPDETLSH